MNHDFIPKDAKIYVAGHRGLMGSALVRTLEAQGYHNLVTRTHAECDLMDPQAVEKFFQAENPEYVFIAAAKVGGIWANYSQPADFARKNLAIELNLIEMAYQYKAKRLLFLGSSCIYPRNCPQPMKEEHLLSGPLELTNRPYAIAKIAGIELCWSYNRQYGTQFLCGMPTNLYGPKDNYDLEMSHVIPGLIRKFHIAKMQGDSEVELWGTGRPRREFLYSDDCAAACVKLMNLSEEDYQNLLANPEMPPLVNIGSGEDIAISELAHLIQKVVGFEGDISFNPEKPDGTVKKLLDVQILKALGWSPDRTLEAGLQDAYKDFLTLPLAQEAVACP